MSDWIDFKQLRRSLDFAAVLRFYDVELKRKSVSGEQRVGYCPLPGHQHRGEKRSMSFSVNLRKGVWQCFGCKAGGNALDFVCRVEGLNPADPAGIRKAALIAREKFLGQASKDASPARRAKPPDVAPPTDVGAAGTAATTALSKGQVLVNSPLDFELKGLDPEHRYLKERGFSGETVRHFGLGFCSRGLLAGRIGIPLRDQTGKLVGYAGGMADERRIDNEHPEYLFPGTRERNGQVLEFRTSLFLYNGHAIREPVEDLIVVQAFPSVWWLTQWGYPHVVALMSPTCSPEQASLIVSLTEANEGCVWAFTDDDSSGEECAASLLPRLALHRPCRRVRPKAGRPTDCTPADLARLFGARSPSPSTRRIFT